MICSDSAISAGIRFDSLPVRESHFLTVTSGSSNMADAKITINNNREIVFQNENPVIGSFRLSFTINTSDFDGWRIIKPIPVSLEIENDGRIIVSDDIFLEYGIGKTQIEARHDYIENLIARHDLLSRRDHIEYPESANELEYLRTFITNVA